MSLAPDRILVVDDDQAIQRLLRRVLAERGFTVEVAGDGAAALLAYQETVPDAVLLDLRLPGMEGMEVLERLRAHDPEATVVIMTGFGSVESVVQAMKAGAADYLTKPLDVDHLELVINKALEGRRQRRELSLLRGQLVQHSSFEAMVGVSQPMQEVYRLIRRLAAGTSTVLIQGETGTGKELAARAIHNLGPRRHSGFMAISCGALPETILESELFGHERGAFTGATRMKYGLIEQAGGGTLFLDEVEAMSPALQVKLLRALQEREVLRVGGERPVPVDFRLLAAANVDLRKHMDQDRFRSDLFYRLSVVTLTLPPLRERRTDIPLLAEHFLRRHEERGGRQVRGFSPEALQLLEGYGWPGNVRELANAVEQALVLCQGEWITPADLPEHLRTVEVPASAADILRLPLRQARDAFEREYLEEALARAQGVVSQAARLAGIPRQYFYEKMKRHDIRPG
ncbi:MAG: sigma-54 dependent transcriptional regulator [Candidatus Latescibacterota bacterium]